MAGIFVGEEENVEEWRIIPNFTNYEVSSMGNIYGHLKRQFVKPSLNNYGYLKISLVCDVDGVRRTKVVARLVGEAFIRPPEPSCDQIMVLDGDQMNVAVYNLAWRPESFVWRYAHQLKVPQPIDYKTCEVLNIVTGVVYRSIVEAGVAEGLLFEDIWRSTINGNEVYPHGHIFEIL